MTLDRVVPVVVASDPLYWMARPLQSMRLVSLLSCVVVFEHPIRLSIVDPILVEFGIEFPTHRRQWDVPSVPRPFYYYHLTYRWEYCRCSPPHPRFLHSNCCHGEFQVRQMHLPDVPHLLFAVDEKMM